MPGDPGSASASRARVGAQGFKIGGAEGRSLARQTFDRARRAGQNVAQAYSAAQGRTGTSKAPKTPAEAVGRRNRAAREAREARPAPAKPKKLGPPGGGRR